MLGASWSRIVIHLSEPAAPSAARPRPQARRRASSGGRAALDARPTPPAAARHADGPSRASRTAQPARARTSAQARLVDERGEQVEDGVAVELIVGADLLGGIEGESARERAQPPKQHSLLGPTAGRGSNRPTRGASGAAAAPRAPPVSRWKRSARPAAICSERGIRTRAAAARSRAGSRRDPSRSGQPPGRCRFVTAKFDRAFIARSMNSLTASYCDSDSTGSRAGSSGSASAGTPSSLTRHPQRRPARRQGRDARAALQGSRSRPRRTLRAGARSCQALRAFGLVPGRR